MSTAIKTERHASVVSRLLDTLAPRRCAICGQRMSVAEDYICFGCRQHQLLTPDFREHPEDNRMVRVFWGQFPVVRAATLTYFRPRALSANMVYAVKYGHRKALAVYLGRMMAERMGEAFFEGIDGIAYVPLTWRRQLWRGYNQCRMMGLGVSQVTGIPLLDGVVRRVTFGGSQTRRARGDRLEAVSHVFQMRHPERLNGKHVLLIDDVMTTGATLTACAKALAHAEDVRVSILTLGLTV